MVRGEPSLCQVNNLTQSGQILLDKLSRGTVDSLSIGAGEGKFGLWLDSNFCHGRSQSCSTFRNSPLCPGNGDFVVKTLEFWVFDWPSSETQRSWRTTFKCDNFVLICWLIPWLWLLWRSSHVNSYSGCDFTLNPSYPICMLTLLDGCYLHFLQSMFIMW